MKAAILHYQIETVHSTAAVLHLLEIQIQKAAVDLASLEMEH